MRRRATHRTLGATTPSFASKPVTTDAGGVGPVWSPLHCVGARQICCDMGGASCRGGGVGDRPGFGPIRPRTGAADRLSVEARRRARRGAVETLRQQAPSVFFKLVGGSEVRAWRNCSGAAAEHRRNTILLAAVLPRLSRCCNQWTEPRLHNVCDRTNNESMDHANEALTFEISLAACCRPPSPCVCSPRG